MSATPANMPFEQFILSTAEKMGDRKISQGENFALEFVWHLDPIKRSC